MSRLSQGESSLLVFKFPSMPSGISCIIRSSKTHGCTAVAQPAGASCYCIAVHTQMKPSPSPDSSLSGVTQLSQQPWPQTWYCYLPWSHSRRSSATFLKCMHAEGERQQPVLSLPLQENPSLGGLDNWTSEVTLQKGLPRVTTPSSQRSSCV